MHEEKTIEDIFDYDNLPPDLQRHVLTFLGVEDLAHFQCVSSLCQEIAQFVESHRSVEDLLHELYPPVKCSDKTNELYPHLKTSNETRDLVSKFKQNLKHQPHFSKALHIHLACLILQHRGNNKLQYLYDDLKQNDTSSDTLKTQTVRQPNGIWTVYLFPPDNKLTLLKHSLTRYAYTVRQLDSRLLDIEQDILRINCSKQYIDSTVSKLTKLSIAWLQNLFAAEHLDACLDVLRRSIFPVPWDTHGYIHYGQPTNLSKQYFKTLLRTIWHDYRTKLTPNELELLLESLVHIGDLETIVTLVTQCDLPKLPNTIENAKCYRNGRLLSILNVCAVNITIAYCHKRYCNDHNTHCTILIYLLGYLDLSTLSLTSVKQHLCDYVSQSTNLSYASYFVMHLSIIASYARWLPVRLCAQAWCYLTVAEKQQLCSTLSPSTNYDTNADIKEESLCNEPTPLDTLPESQRQLLIRLLVNLLRIEQAICYAYERAGIHEMHHTEESRSTVLCNIIGELLQGSEHMDVVLKDFLVRHYC